MTVLRTDIEKALDEIISNEEGMRFQGIAVVLAKQKWPDLVACERKSDLGLDAHASAVLSANGKGKGVASSITNTLEKVRDDAKNAKENFDNLSILIFATPRKVSEKRGKEWQAKIREEFGLDLIVMPREDIITSLMLPSNAGICRSQLRISIPLDQTSTEHLAKIRDATSEVLHSWASHPRLAGRPLISLSSMVIGSNGSDTNDVFSLDALASALVEGRRIILEGPAGRGKTTTLVQIAKRRQSEEKVSLLVNLPDWIRSQKGIFEFVARAPQFASRGITSQHLAAGFNEEPFAFLLNGWNEISEKHQEDALSALAELERDFPSAGILVATRTQAVGPPLPGSLRLKLRPLSRTQRAEYLTQSLPAGADELRARLESSRVLDDLTRTPLILAEVVTLHKAGKPIPATKLDVLDAVMDVVEKSEEHRGQLLGAPLQGFGRDYLIALATEMTKQGAVQFSESNAREICFSVGEKLRAAQQISTLPDPPLALAALSAHHVLERIEYPSPAFRFEHQQFQEFFAAQFLRAALTDVARDGDAAHRAALVRDYMNHPVWTEPFAMVAEEIGANGEDASAVQAGKQLVTMFLDIDPLFASELAYLTGPNVWTAVREPVAARLRSLYQSASATQRQYALVAMVETGSSDFSDVIVPLLASDDHQFRLRRMNASFHLSSLGTNWLKVVLDLPEQRQLNFVFDIMRDRWASNVGEELLQSNPSTKVKAQIIESFAWNGDETALARHLGDVDDETFASVLSRLSPQEIPGSVWPRVVKTYKAQLEATTDPVQRINTLLKMAELDGPAALESIKAGLEAFPSGRIRNEQEHSVLGALEEVAKSDPQWVSTWATKYILDGSLWADHAKKFVTHVPSELRAELIDSLATKSIPYPDLTQVLTVLKVGGDRALGAAAFSKQCDVRRTITDPRDPKNKTAHDAIRQLEVLLHGLPEQAMAEGILECVGGDFDAVQFGEAVDLLGRIGNDDADLRDLSEQTRGELRRYFKAGVEFALRQRDFSGYLKASLALAIARVGNPADAPEIEQLINADIERVAVGRAAIVRGEANETTNGARTIQTNWLVRAVELLGSDVAEPILLRLLEDSIYEGAAGDALIRMARRTKPEGLLRSGALDYAVVWEARKSASAEFDQTRRERYAKALRQRVGAVMEERSKDAKPEYFSRRLKHLAYQLAILDGANEVALVLEIEALPAEWDGWERTGALKTLLLAGASLPIADVLKVLEPVIAHTFKRGLHDDQTARLLADCLCILLFVKEQSLGVAKVREVLVEAKFPGHRLREVMAALGDSHSDDAAQLLLDLANESDRFLTNVTHEWVDALTSSKSAKAKEVLLSISLSDTPPVKGLKLVSHGIDERLANYLASAARAHQDVRDRFFALSNEVLSNGRRHLLAKVFAHLGTAEAALAALNLMRDGSTERIPYELRRMIESTFMEQQPDAGTSNAYSLVPRDASAVRARLFDMASDDPQRRKSAIDLLAEIELSRHAYGRPISEARHPALESGKPWPPIPLPT